MVLKKKKKTHLKDVPDIFRLCHDSFKDTAAILMMEENVSPVDHKAKQ